MDVLILLIPLSVVLVLLVGAGFWWSVKSGQYDDLEGPAHRILADDDGGAAPERPRANDAAAQARLEGLTEVKQGRERLP
jgi:cbb3-type cytochrome oxidase maturation protein